MDEIKVYASEDNWYSDFTPFAGKYKNLINYDGGITHLIYEKVAPVPESETKHYFEIGCYLARYMYHFGKLGYTLNGIDQTTHMGQPFINFLVDEKFKVGEIWNEDVFKLKTDKQFDYVASFGFIEHFSNFLELIDLHFALTKKDGQIMITIPNYGGWIQHTLQWLINGEHLRTHNMKALQPDVWKKHIQKHNYEVIFDGYTGGFDIWVNNQKRNIFQKAFVKLLFNQRFIKKLRNIKSDHSSYSAYYCLILKKK